MQTQDVIKVCAALVKAGKKPTIGLVRASLANKVALATVVKGIQQFQSNRKLGIVVESELVTDIKSAGADKATKMGVELDAPPSSSTCNCEQRVLLLEQQIEKLTRQLTDLHTQVLTLNRP
ncbi:MAG: hypothetical protein ACJAW1_000567 [Glaciecola sp.]|jgi:hypothetical protein